MLSETGIRVLREKPVFTTPNVFAPDDFVQREVEDAEGNYAKTLKTQPAQNAHLEFEEFRVALDKLPQDQREALILVGASGFSYEDAAAICGCAVGTIKSRVNRARSKLSALLYVDGAEDFGPDDTVRAVIGGNGG